MSSHDPFTVAQAEEMQRGLTAQMATCIVKIDDLSDVITGEDPLHPNGLRAKVDRNADGLIELRAEWREFQASAKGFAVGIGLSAAVIGGGVATIANRILGSG